MTAWTAPVGGGKFNYTPAPAGNHIARLSALIDTGTHEREWQGQKKIAREVVFVWELLNEMNEEGKAFMVRREFNLSMHEKAGMRLAIESWRGRKFTEEEAGEFDISKLLGHVCLVNVVHKENKKDPKNPYANVASITPPPKGMPVPPAKNPVVIFHLDNYSQTVFESLGKGTRAKIMESPEWKELAAKGAAFPKVEKPSDNPRSANPSDRAYSAPVNDEDPFAGVPVRDGNEEIDF